MAKLNFEKDIKDALMQMKRLSKGSALKISEEKALIFLKKLAEHANGPELSHRGDGHKAGVFNKIVYDASDFISSFKILNIPKCPKCQNFIFSTGYGRPHDDNYKYTSYFCLNCGNSLRIFEKSGKIETLKDIDFEEGRE